MKTLIRLVNKLDRFLYERSPAFWMTGLILVAVLCFIGTVLLGGLALWGITSLLGFSAGYWPSVLIMFFSYIIVGVLSLPFKSK